MGGLHEKVRQYVIEQNLAKSGISTVWVDRVSTSRQKDYSTFVTYALQILTINLKTKDLVFKFFVIASI